MTSFKTSRFSVYTLLYFAVLALGAIPARATGLVVTPGDNVGIGTTSPGAKLDVSGTNYIRLDPGEPALLYSNAGSFNIKNSANGGDLLFIVNNNATASMMISHNNGNVGIGTANPTRGILHVAGGRINLEGNSGDSAAVITLGNATYPTAQITTPYAGGTLSLNGASGNGILIGSSGNVAIGTGSPAMLLDIMGSDKRMRIGDGTNQLTLGQWDTTNNRIESSGRPLFLTTYAGSINLGPSGSAALTITSGSNVGIGTTSPGYKLEVAGAIRASEIITDNYDWADYVFDKDYKLAPLSEVEKTIKEEKHLPGIPSAAEVAKHGIDLGKMQAQLLQKIEELTLHQIEQEKNLSAQQNQLAHQQKRLDEQSKRIEQLEKENAELRGQP